MKEKPSLILPDFLLIQSDICSDIILACEIRGWERKKGCCCRAKFKKNPKSLGLRSSRTRHNDANECLQVALLKL